MHSVQIISGSVNSDNSMYFYKRKHLCDHYSKKYNYTPKCNYSPTSDFAEYYYDIVDYYNILNLYIMPILKFYLNDLSVRCSFISS